MTKSVAHGRQWRPMALLAGIAVLAGILGAQQPAKAEAAIEPPDALAERGYITYCATLDNPPRAFLTVEQDPTGFEVDLGEEIAARLGLEARWSQLKFTGLIPALQAGQCDALMQELFIRPERLEIIDMIPFSNTGQRIVAHVESDLQPASLTDLSGLKVAVPNGTTIHNLAMEANAELEAAAKPAIGLVILPTTTETFKQLSTRQVDAVGTTMTAAAYYVGLEPDQFRAVGDPFGLIKTGIGVAKTNSELTAAITEAFDAIVEDGTYDRLIEEYGMQGSEL